MRILEGEGVTKHFGGLAAVLHVNFSVDQGAIVGLIGPNGAGKTTLFNLISGALGPTWFETFGGGGGLLAVECHPGEIGQWQNGVFEVIGPKDKATADPIYPKPVWPAP